MLYKENSNCGIKNDVEVGEDWGIVRTLHWVPNRAEQAGNGDPGEAEWWNPSTDGILRPGFYSKEKKRVFHVHAHF